MIESLNTTISTYTLSQFAEKGILCFICDKTHTPNGIILPFCGHYQTLVQYQNQINMSKPLQKQLWQTIIKNKIKNQNDVLNICGTYDKLKNLYETVLSGDSTNNEAKASLIYFKELFGNNFIRRDENTINALLNYGYAIIRSFVARSLTVHGLLPFLGIFHCNQFNQFNLADDLMEVFRPVVDLYIKKNFNLQTKIDSQTKAKIYNIINHNIMVENQCQSVSYAIELFVQSFQKSIKENKNCLKQIQIMEIDIHQYE